VVDLEASQEVLGLNCGSSEKGFSSGDKFYGFPFPRLFIKHDTHDTALLNKSRLAH
jgi:hypothetical protein